MLRDRLRAISELAKSGEHEAAHVLALEIARTHPDDVRTQLAAAYACDRLGFEDDALQYFRAASRIGIPRDERPKFLLSFGSTLRNVGRVDEAVNCLLEGVRENSECAEFRAFLALAYHSAGQDVLAVGTMLDAALMASRDNGFGIYGRALREYRDTLLGDVSPQIARKGN